MMVSPWPDVYKRQGEAGEGGGGTEGAVAVAVDDLGVGAVGNVLGKNVGVGDILEAGLIGGQGIRNAGGKEQVANDLCGRAARCV